MSIRKLVMTLALGAAIGATATTALTAAGEPKAYMIAQIEITGDADAYVRDYASKVQAATDPFGGHYLARGGRTVALEGRKPGSRVAVIEFPSLSAAQGFYNSPAYQSLAAVRHRLATTDAFIVEGVAPAP